MKSSFRKIYDKIPSGILCLLVVFALFGYLGSSMGTPNMLNTIMNTAHDLLLNTVFYLMAICVITGALGRIFIEFGVVRLLEKILRPLICAEAIQISVYRADGATTKSTVSSRTIPQDGVGIPR